MEYGETSVDVEETLRDGTFVPTTTRPTDDQILHQENAIRAEIAEKLQFVGDRVSQCVLSQMICLDLVVIDVIFLLGAQEPLSALAAEYADGSATFGEKIKVRQHPEHVN